jgi:hypothetical protein
MQTWLAIVPIGGLLTSTLLNTIVVPVLLNRGGDAERLRTASDAAALGLEARAFQSPCTAIRPVRSASLHHTMLDDTLALS